MTRDKWRELCKRTREWERSVGRYIHMSTAYEWDKKGNVVKRYMKNRTYFKGFSNG